MSDEKFKRTQKPSAKPSSLGIPQNVVVGPPRFEAELNSGAEDQVNPGSSHNRNRDELQKTLKSRVPAPIGIGRGYPSAGEDPGNARWGFMGDESIVSAPMVAPIDVTREASDGFGSLTALLERISAISANHEEAVAVRNKIEGLLTHVAQLDALFATSPGDKVEQRRRGELIRKIEGIEGRLRALYEKLESQRTEGRANDDEDVFAPLEDLQEVVLRYKMAQQTIIDNRGLKSMDPAEAAILNNFRCAQQAEYRHGNRDGCLKGTRSAILDEIEFWARSLYSPPVYWLNGLAGTGKSTIAQTIAERMFADGLLGASFFCSRDFEDRRNLQFIFPTIAVQLARKYPEFRSIFIPLVRSDPEIAYESLYGQMNKLIFQPLAESAISTVIVIDALDDCKDEEPASAVLSVLSQFVAEIPQVKFFVTGRPEPRIREGFRLPLLLEATDVFVLHEIELSRVNRDIQLFFTHKFLELKGRRRGLDGWPTREQLDVLCERTAGLFVHAMATIRFIDQRNCNPRRQLDCLLQLPGSSALEGKTKFRADATLDSLYMSIFHEAFGDDDPQNDHRIRLIVGAVALAASPLSPSAIATLLNFDVEDVFPLLSSIHSLLVLHEDVTDPVRPFHKSFPDFIADSARCSSPRFCVSPPVQHVELLLSCLQLMDQRLEKNMCKLPDGVINSEIDDLKQRVERWIDEALQYASRSWHKHLRHDMTPAQRLRVTPALHHFLEKKFLFWLEVLSVLGATREAVDALELTSKWLDALPSLDLVNDCFRFLITFFEAISTSASHIYISALLLSPRKSIIRTLYQQHARPLARVVRGLPISWESVIATVYHKEFTTVAAWSPCSRLIGVAKSGTVEVLDAVTLKRLSSFKPPTRFLSQWLGFSPDSRFLAQFDARGNLAFWDLQTGCIAGTKLSEEDQYHRIFSATYSPDGNVFAFACQDSLFDIPLIVIYDLSGADTKSHHILEGCLLSPIWSHGEYLRFATLESHFIVIREVAFTGGNAPTKVNSLPLPNKIDGELRSPLFLPVPPRIAFISESTTLIWDAQDSKFLLDFVDTTKAEIVDISFSSGGRFFACILRGKGLHVWEESPAGYALFQELAFAARFDARSLFSPNEGSTITLNRSTTYLLPTKDPTPPSTTVPVDDQSNFILGFFQNEELAAVARLKTSAVEIFDPKSGDTWTVLDVGMEVFCLRVAGSTLVVVGDEGQVVTWDTRVGGCSSGARENIGDNVQTTTLDRSETDDPSFEPHPFTSISPDLNYIAIIESTLSSLTGVTIYDVSSGKYLARVPFIEQELERLWFTPERQLLCLVDYRVVDSRVVDSRVVGRRISLGGGEPRVMGWAITGYDGSGPIKLERLAGTTVQLSGGPPWGSPCGYGVTDDGWVLSATEKRLLWLPHYWRSGERNRTWHGRFLGLLQHELPEAVILEFSE